MLGMKKGGRRFLIIPPAWAYGAQGVAGRVPADSTLVFEVEVRRVSVSCQMFGLHLFCHCKVGTCSQCENSSSETVRNLSKICIFNSNKQTQNRTLNPENPSRLFVCCNCLGIKLSHLWVTWENKILWEEWEDVKTQLLQLWINWLLFLEVQELHREWHHK